MWNKRKINSASQWAVRGLWIMRSCLLSATSCTLAFRMKWHFGGNRGKNSFRFLISPSFSRFLSPSPSFFPFQQQTKRILSSLVFFLLPFSQFTAAAVREVERKIRTVGIILKPTRITWNNLTSATTRSDKCCQGCEIAASCTYLSALEGPFDPVKKHFVWVVRRRRKASSTGSCIAISHVLLIVFARKNRMLRALRSSETLRHGNSPGKMKGRKFYVNLLCADAPERGYVSQSLLGWLSYIKRSLSN